MKKKRKYIYLEKCLIICILQICIFSFYDFLFFISLSYKKTSESIACYKLCGNFSGMDTRQAAPESGAACFCGGRFG